MILQGCNQLVDQFFLNIKKNYIDELTELMKDYLNDKSNTEDILFNLYLYDKTKTNHRITIRFY